jgi:YD repeat-containing protein
VTNSLGHDTTYLGNEQGLVVQVIDSRAGLWERSFNEYNEPLSATDPLGFKTSYTYDNRGNCIHTLLPDGSEQNMSMTKRTGAYKLLTL